jgi:hypothetical protein
VHQFTKVGVDPLRLEIVGFGEYHPLQPNDSVAGRNANRRVTILVLEASVPAEALAARVSDLRLAPGAMSASSGLAAADVSGAQNRLAVSVPPAALERTLLVKKAVKPE